MNTKKNEIVLFEEQGVKLEVSVKDDTVWLTQKQMEQLFNVTHATISGHINNVFSEGELDESTCRNFRQKYRGKKVKSL